MLPKYPGFGKMNIKRLQLTTYLLAVLTTVLGCVAAILWLLPTFGIYDKQKEERYGVYEGMELVARIDDKGGRMYVVDDADGGQLFVVPVRDCILDTRYRNGSLRFKEKATGREGFIDRQGRITLMDDGRAMAVPMEKSHTAISFTDSRPATESTPPAVSVARPVAPKAATRITHVDLRTMAHSNPFYREAAKILKGGLTEDDAARRRKILDYCEHFRTAYTTKDIDFLRQVFSDNALIIVGNVVRTSRNRDNMAGSGRVRYSLRTKSEYLAKLTQAFAASNKIDVKFSDFRITRHPTMDGIYGVTLRQKYRSDRYGDDGYVFLLWDFRDPSMPLIHVRTWQPSKSVGGAGDVIGMTDFNFE